MREFFKRNRNKIEFLSLLAISVMLIVFGSILHSLPTKTVEKPCYDQYYNVIQNTTCIEEVPKTDSVSMSTLIELGPLYIVVGVLALVILVIVSLWKQIERIINEWP